MTVIAKYCKEVQEMRGFYPADEKLVKSALKIVLKSSQGSFFFFSFLNTSFVGIVKAAPNLRVLEISDCKFEVRFFFSLCPY